MLHVSLSNHYLSVTHREIERGKERVREGEIGRRGRERKRLREGEIEKQEKGGEVSKVKLENKPLISAKCIKYLLHDILIKEYFICRVMGVFVYN